MSKLTNLIKSIPKRTAAILITLAAVLVPAVIFAAGSTNPANLDITHPVDYITFDSYTNNQGWGDEHDFVRVGPTSIASTSDLSNSVAVKEGGEYYVYMYVHNNAASWLNLVATGVKGQYDVLDENTKATTKQIRGFIDADNCGAKQNGNGGQTAGSACTFWDEASFTSADGRKFTMQYVPGSAVYINKSGKFTISDNVASENTSTGGALLGDTSMNGQIPGCAEHQGFLIIKVKPVFEPPVTHPSYDVEKKVNNATHNSVKPGDTMTYTITAKNTGDVDLTNVKINDTLPAYYSSSATETLPAGATGSIVNAPHTVTIPKLAVGQTQTITISYKVKGESAFECGKTTNFKNVVTSSTDQDSTEDNTNNNQVDTDVTYPCAPKTPSYDLVKTVDKTSAKPGDTLKYTLTFRNTGDVALTNVVIKDMLPAGVTYNNDLKTSTPNGCLEYDITTNLNCTESLTTVPYTGNLFDGGMKIAKVGAGRYFTITFSVKVNSDAVTADKCGANSKVLTNAAESSVTEKPDQANNADEDNAKNNSVDTTVTVDKDCNYGYDLVKTGPATAKPGETVTYTLTFHNTGNQPLTNVVVKDTLPTNVTYVAGSTTVDGAKKADGVTTSAGLNIGTVAAGKTVTIKFQAKMPSADKLDCGKTTLTNKSSAVSKEDTTEDRTDNNNYDTVVERVCTPNFDLVKTVDKTIAKPGDTLKYTLTFRNTGEIDLTNIVIKDTLPTGLTVVGETKANVTNGSGISDLDKLFTTGAKVASVKVGGVVTITFSAKVNSDAVTADECGANSKILVNKSSSTTKEKTDESDKTNNDTSTTVTVKKDCDDSYDVIKTVDKAAAKPGDTLIYTILVKNTGNTDLTNIVVKDTLPNYIASAKATTTASSTVSGNLFKEGVKIAKLKAGETATIKVTAVVKNAANMPCGETVLTNRVDSSTDQVKNEDDLTNNTADTTIDRDCPPTPTPTCPTNPKIDADNPECKPCVYNPNMNYDDPLCVPPVTPTRPTPPPVKPYTPEYVVATGPVEAAAAIVGTGALTFGTVAYVRSRKDLMGKMLRK
jgi:uncharacterized repeat protein (TIGR01451 family)